MRNVMIVAIEIEGAAFDDPESELGRIFRRLGQRFEDHSGYLTAGKDNIHDLNGNDVGQWSIIQVHEEEDA